MANGYVYQQCHSHSLFTQANLEPKTPNRQTTDEIAFALPAYTSTSGDMRDSGFRSPLTPLKAQLSLGISLLSCSAWVLLARALLFLQYRIVLYCIVSLVSLLTISVFHLDIFLRSFLSSQSTPLLSNYIAGGTKQKHQRKKKTQSMANSHCSSQQRPLYVCKPIITQYSRKAPAPAQKRSSVCFPRHLVIRYLSRKKKAPDAERAQILYKYGSQYIHTKKPSANRLGIHPKMLI
ncbi:hypothetical protein GGI42DRAFT_92116 [Trichoderma sp. SZMC 28013]